MAEKLIDAVTEAHQEAVRGFFAAQGDALDGLAERLAQAFAAGNTLLLCGNGGSACDAMHAAGECVGRFVKDRQALPAIALTADAGILTAVGNDYGFSEIFARQVAALGKKGDVLLGLSTSGQSENVLRALEVGRERGLYTVLLTGEKGAELEGVAELVLAVPSAVTARIQEVHHMALHMLIALVEQHMGIA